MKEPIFASHTMKIIQRWSASLILCRLYGNDFWGKIILCWSIGLLQSGCIRSSPANRRNKRNMRAFDELLLTLRGQTLFFKDVKTVLLALCVHLFLGGGSWRWPLFIRPLQQSQVVLQRMAQVIAVAAGYNSNIILNKYGLYCPKKNQVYFMSDKTDLWPKHSSFC